jgi:alpha-tubulin suppressor-like RCC1 family protein
VAASANNAFALAQDGSVWAWGDNGQGELGNGRETFTSRFPCSSRRVEPYSRDRRGRVLRLRSRPGPDGLGVGRQQRRPTGQPLSVGNSDVPVEVRHLTDATQVAAGASTAYVLRRGGSVWAWGDNAFGELARSTGMIGGEVPLRIAQLAPASGIAAGSNVAFALLRDGTVRAWGDGSFRDLGTGSCSHPRFTYQLPRGAQPGGRIGLDQRPCHRRRDLRDLCSRG